MLKSSQKDRYLVFSGKGQAFLLIDDDNMVFIAATG